MAGSLMDNPAGSFALNRAGAQAGKDSLCPSLTLKQRLIGFGVTTCLGLLISILSFVAFLTGSGVTVFAIFYTIGTVLSLTASMFLSGPLKQLKQMFDKTRIITTLVLLGSILTVLLTGIIAGIMNDEVGALGTIIILVGIIVEYCAYFWYSLSYIPYGRTIVCKCFKKGVEQAA
eukprot:CAMPEP_0202958294 /NCGR_PEP_ID=MMETSP1396-20130829/2657_1 /ASSEMBLY_ACC=CAM_ASM_000872 /TAXON_ID= /ORGANISM="Pseudokeronopsis sp., Strain Brazil" /LENGTH=174 /DNA_ID=CAMNT_0049676293 /DNA_START=9 /DNA_END=533 /DNA_ORIENTATION=+